MRSTREKFRGIFRTIFYLAPLSMFKTRGLEHQHLETAYLYIHLFFGSLIFIPWICLAIWGFMTSVGCQSNIMRPYIENICIRPYLGPYMEKPIYMAFWEAYHADDGSLSKSIPHADKTFMLGSLVMDDAVSLLRHEVLELDVMSGAFPDMEELSRVLRGSYMIRILGGLANLAFRYRSSHYYGIRSCSSPRPLRPRHIRGERSYVPELSHIL